MSLNDINKKINSSSSNPYIDKKVRIGKEWEGQKELADKKQADTDTKQLSHLMLHKENLAGQISQLKKDIYNESRSANSNRSFLAEREKMLHKLQRDHLEIQGEILAKKGVDTGPAHNVRFNKPHYF
ncbi:MAG TPA: hypothetical protein VJH63_01645 [Candidatus Paceibacterota bacterium]